MHHFSAAAPSWNTGSRCGCCGVCLRPIFTQPSCQTHFRFIHLRQLHHHHRRLASAALFFKNSQRDCSSPRRPIRGLSRSCCCCFEGALRSRPSKDTLVPIPIPSSLLFANDRQTARRTDDACCEIQFLVSDRQAGET